MQADLNRLVHDLAIDHDGSISAEHGLGALRGDEAARYKMPVELDLMAAIKKAFDPAAMFNPGKGIGRANMAPPGN